MLIQKEVRSRKNIILLVITIFSLAVSGYLFYSNWQYYNQGVGRDLFALQNQAMQATKKQTLDTGITGWRFLDVKTNFLRENKVQGLRSPVAPLRVEEIIKGKVNIFQSIFNQQ